MSIVLSDEAMTEIINKVIAEGDEGLKKSNPTSVYGSLGALKMLLEHMNLNDDHARVASSALIRFVVAAIEKGAAARALKEHEEKERFVRDVTESAKDTDPE